MYKITWDKETGGVLLHSCHEGWLGEKRRGHTGVLARRWRWWQRRER